MKITIHNINKIKPVKLNYSKKYLNFAYKYSSQIINLYIKSRNNNKNIPKRYLIEISNSFFNRGLINDFHKKYDKAILYYRYGAKLENLRCFVSLLCIYKNLNDYKNYIITIQDLERVFNKMNSNDFTKFKEKTIEMCEKLINYYNKNIKVKLQNISNKL
jgi:hypothetical protein